MTTTTNTALTILNEATNQYNKGGLNSAGGYILVIMGLAFIAGTIWYVKYTQSQMEKRIIEKNEENNQLVKVFENVLKSQSDNLTNINNQMLSSLKEISEEVRDGINYLNSKSIEMNDKFIGCLNERELTQEEFEKQVKCQLELNMLRLFNSLCDRISENNLVALKSTLVGDEAQKYSNGQLAGIIKKCAVDAKNALKDLNYRNIKVKTKTFEKIDNEISRICYEIGCIFVKVEPNYYKTPIFRDVKTSVFSVINTFNEISIEE